jgi:hypothetical protein
MKDSYDAILVGIAKISNGISELKTNPDDTVLIELGDYLLIMADGACKKRLSNEFGVEEGRVH